MDRNIVSFFTKNCSNFFLSISFLIIFLFESVNACFLPGSRKFGKKCVLEKFKTAVKMADEFLTKFVEENS